MSTSKANHSMAYAWVYYPGAESRVRSAASDSDRRCRERIGVSPYSPESVGFLFRDVGPARRASRCRRPHPLAAAHQRPRPSPHSTALGPEPAASMPGRREIEKGGRAVRRAERGRIPAGPAGSSPRGGNGARTAAAGPDACGLRVVVRRSSAEGVSKACTRRRATREAADVGSVCCARHPRPPSAAGRGRVGDSDAQHAGLLRRGRFGR